MMSGAASWFEQLVPMIQDVEPNVPAVHRTHVDDASERQAVQAECIQQVCLQPFYYIFAGLSGASLLLLVVHRQVPHLRGVVWLAALFLARALVRILAVRFGTEAMSPTRVRRWLYLGSEALQGCVWAAAPFVLQVREQRYEMFTVVTLVAVATISSLIMAPFFAAAVSFTVPVAFGLAIWMAGRGGSWGWHASAGVLAIYGMSIYHARVANRDFKAAIFGRHEIARLATALELANARTEAANAELQMRHDRLQEIARRDPLTGLFNRRHFIEWFERVRTRDNGEHRWFLAILDADYFKRFNDEFGHQVGDQVLISIAKAATSEIRWTDCFARIGGEEFGLLLQDVSFDEAVAIVERVRAAVSAVDLGVGRIALSVGLLEGQKLMDVSVALARADAALYEAKRTGRDRVVCDPALPIALEAAKSPRLPQAVSPVLP
jgi:diguanylate cyclase (GGDEF)-like protein